MAEIDQERIARAWSLRTHEGKSYQEIADTLGVAKSTAHAWVGQAVDAWEQGPSPDRHALRTRDVATVDAWLERGETLYTAGDLSYPDAVRAVLGLLGHKARLLGLYAPVRVAVDDVKRPPDPVLIEAMRLEAQRAEENDLADVDEALGLVT